MTSWITSFFTSTPNSHFLTTDGRNSTSLVQFPDHGVDEELPSRLRQEERQVARWEQEDTEMARPPYLHVSGLRLGGQRKQFRY